LNQTQRNDSRHLQFLVVEKLAFWKRSLIGGAESFFSAEQVRVNRTGGDGGLSANREENKGGCAMKEVSIKCPRRVRWGLSFLSGMRFMAFELIWLETGEEGGKLPSG